MIVAPWLLLLENRRKIEPKEIPSCLNSRLLVVFTRQLEILVTTLHMHLFFGTDCVFFNLVNSDGVLYFFVCVVFSLCLLEELCSFLLKGEDMHLHVQCMVRLSKRVHCISKTENYW